MPKLMVLLEEFEQAVRDHNEHSTGWTGLRYHEAKLALVRAMQEATQRKGETE